MIRPGSDPEAIAEAAQRIRAGALVGFPTETVYGLGADASNDAAVALIFSAKGRPPEHPLIVHVARAAQVADYASEVPPFAAKLIQAFWPGPLTLILPRRAGVAAAAAGGQNSIGLRCPAHPVALTLLQACGTGLAGPSANRFGRVSPTTALHVQEELGEDLLVLDGGPCAVGIESTIIDCTRGQPVLLRPGLLTRAQLEAACCQPVLDKDTPVKTSVKTQAPRASGTLESHYAPNARVRLMDAKGLQTGLDTLDSKAKGPAARTGTVAVYARSPLRMNTNILYKRMPEDAALAAQQLFAVLRELDATAVSEIWVQIPPDAPEWDGVRDRLNRAAADGSPPKRG